MTERGPERGHSRGRNRGNGRGHRGGRGGRGGQRLQAERFGADEDDQNSASNTSQPKRGRSRGRNRGNGRGHRGGRGGQGAQTRQFGSFDGSEDDRSTAYSSDSNERNTHHHKTSRGRGGQRGRGRQERGRGDKRDSFSSNANDQSRNHNNEKSRRASGSEANREPKHWKTKFGFKRLTDLENSNPDTIVLEMATNTEQFQCLLNEEGHSQEMIVLVLKNISKACEERLLRTNLQETLLAFVASKFIRTSLFPFLKRIKTVASIQGEDEEALLCILKICTEIKMRLPTTSYEVELLAVTSVLKDIVSAFSSTQYPVSTQVVSAFEDLHNLKEIEEENVETRFKPRSSQDENQNPPQDFHEIPVFPEMHDILVDMQPFLRANKTTGKYDSLHHYLDVHFRLLREDFIGPLRDGIQKNIAWTKRSKKGKKIDKPRDIKIYTDVKIISSVCNSSGLCNKVSFTCPRLKRIRWESSKQLLYGSLVGLSSDDFDTVYFATVGNRDIKDLKRGMVDLKFETDSAESMSGGKDAEFKMAESSAFFEAYRHVLSGMKSMRKGELPFEKYIVSCETDVEPPRYLRQNRYARYDLRPIVDDEFQIVETTDMKENRRAEKYSFSTGASAAKNVRVTDQDQWPDHKLLKLDESQFKAVQIALSKELAVIQGPPGTGKTYIGLKIVKALLHNKAVWTNGDENSPILIVCYTNHALDQFLEGIMNFFQGNILRLGSRSSMDIMKNYNINTKRLEMRRNRKVPLAIFRERVKTRVRLNDLKDIINSISKRIEKAKREVLHEDTLRPFVSRNIMRQLEEGFRWILNQMNVYGMVTRSNSAMLEWLGYGNLAGSNEAFQFPSQNRQTRKYVQSESDSEETDDEFIDAEDEVQREMYNRTADVFDAECADLDRNAATEEITRIFAAAGVFVDRVALNVSSITSKRSRYQDPNGWQVDSKQLKRIKSKIRHELTKNDRMTSMDVSKIRNIWELPQEERWRLYRFWTHCYCEQLHEQIRDSEIDYKHTCVLMNELQMQEDKTIMERSSVIGLTTTCAARYQSVLQSIGPKIIVVEEAAEVLEAHIITTLSKHSEHLILIGDHKQLQPNPAVYKLEKEYNLNISLFERLIKNNLEYCCLSRQHRMRPEISRVMRIIYPNLEDHESVKQFESIKGVSSNAFFIDHREMESQDDDGASKSNLHEAEFIVALCKYLMLQGYSPNQITILTLYSAQLFELRRKMPRQQFNGVKLTVVDNYQGEENDIILLSLVRSNKGGNLGFVGIENRICVSFSRAKKGFYVIGNFNMLQRRNKVWKQMVDLAKENQMIGPHLILKCQNHPDDKGIACKSADDFKKAPEGGCSKPCEVRLNCSPDSDIGHVCTRVCHTYDRDHSNFKCMKPCEKIVCNNEHKCRRKCWQKCGPCKVKISKILPGCGHRQDVPCSEDPTLWQCLADCEFILTCGHKCQKKCFENHSELCQIKIPKQLNCGHKESIFCWQREQEMFVCTEPCNTVLKCGHICTGTCGECNSGKLHKACTHKCKRPLVCEHECKDNCTNCPPCSHKCQNRCLHSICQRTCGEMCNECIEPCEWSCEHISCKELCSRPCKRPRCNEPCTRTLMCGHPCIGLCGETCPRVCRICNKDEVSEIFFGSEDEEDARFVQLQDCSHFFEVTGLDHWMDQVIESDGGQSSIKLKVCPKCKTPIRRNLRYGNIIKETLRYIEKVKRQIIGNSTRISDLKMSFISENAKLPLDMLEDRAKMNQLYSKFATMTGTEQIYNTINNQVIFLKHLQIIREEFLKKVGTDSKCKDLQKSLMSDTMSLKTFITRERKLITEQEETDIVDELDRLRYFNKLIALKGGQNNKTIRLSESQLNTVSRAERYLLCGKRLSFSRKSRIEQLFKETESLLKRSGLRISDDERIQILKAMDLKKGHWYKCPNGHVYAIGDCGGATVESRCPECNAKIGGGSHRLRNDNAVATEMDGATHSAWSEEAFMENYDPFEIRF